MLAQTLVERVRLLLERGLFRRPGRLDLGIRRFRSRHQTRQLERGSSCMVDQPVGMLQPSGIVSGQAGKLQAAIVVLGRQFRTAGQGFDQRCGPIQIAGRLGRLGRGLLQGGVRSHQQTLDRPVRITAAPGAAR